MIVALNVLVDGEARGELDFAFCACSRFFPGVVTRKSKETILLSLSPQSERNKQRDGECAAVHRVCAITMLITNKLHQTVLFMI